MFGNPQWFRPKAIGFGLIPVRWEGWAYSAAYIGSIGLPYWLLTARHQSLEALMWLVLATGTISYDVWRMWRTLRQSRTGFRKINPTEVRLSCRAAD